MAHKKDGDPLKQRLLDEAKRTPPSRGLMEVELRDIGHPLPELTAKLLDDNAISLTPVDKPARKTRNAPRQPPSAPIIADMPTSLPPPRLLARVRAVAVRFAHDTLYAMAVHSAKYAIFLFLFSIVTGGSFIAFLEYDLKDKVDRFLKGTQPRTEARVRPPPQASSEIETGSIAKEVSLPPATPGEPPAPVAVPPPTWSYELRLEHSPLAPVGQ